MGSGRRKGNGLSDDEHFFPSFNAGCVNSSQSAKSRRGRGHLFPFFIFRSLSFSFSFKLQIIHRLSLSRLLFNWSFFHSIQLFISRIDVEFSNAKEFLYGQTMRKPNIASPFEQLPLLLPRNALLLPVLPVGSDEKTRSSINRKFEPSFAHLEEKLLLSKQ